MSTDALTTTARALVAPGKGILAADESNATMTKRLEAVGVESSSQSRIAFRELLITAPSIGDHISGVILYEETLRQRLSDGTPVPAALEERGILPGIKVDTGAKPLAGADGETVTEGLDGLRKRLAEFGELGASFAKWRATFTIGDDRPSACCVAVNAHALARYAALCQEAGIVPIVEPEVLMEGAHSLARCAEATTAVLSAVFAELRLQRVLLEGVLLKPNMVLPGLDSSAPADEDAIATATLDVLRRTVPAAVPGIVFLSGGQDDDDATARLDALNRRGPQPWELSFSFGRALQAAALRTWASDATDEDAVATFVERVRATAAARGVATATL